MSIKNHTEQYPFLQRFSKAISIPPEDLVEAFEIEKKFHKLILVEKNKNRRIELYNQLYTAVHPIYKRSSLANQDPSKLKSRKALLFKKELKNKSILEVGCGQGVFIMNCSKFKNIKELCGIDVSLPSEEIIKQYPKIKFINADITEFKVLQKYEVVYSNHVLEHMATVDLHTHLASIKEALIEGGKLIINMPNRLFGPSDVTRIIDYSYTGKTEALGSHFNESTYNELISLLKEYGFENFKTVFPHTILRHVLPFFRMPASILCKLEKSKFFMKMLHGIKYKGRCIAKLELSIICNKK